MAGNEQKKGNRRQGERVVPSLDTRMSRASGSYSPPIQSTHVEQRSNIPASRQGRRSGPSSTTPRKQSVQPARGKASSASSSRRGNNSGSSSSSRRGGSSSSNRGATSSSRGAAPETRDTHFVRWAHERWNALEPHQQQRFGGMVLLCLSLLLFSSLTIFSTAPVLSGINQFFLTFFSWGAYPLAIGLIALALAHLVEGLRNQRVVRNSMVVGLFFIWLLLLIESRLILGKGSAGVLAEVLAIPLVGWPGAAQHVVVIGLLLIACIFTFRITFGHVLMVYALIQHVLSDPVAEAEEAEQDGQSPYVGQMPRYSRYSSQDMVPETPQPRSRPGIQPQAQPSRPGRRYEEEEVDDGTIIIEGEMDEHDERTVEFDPDFEEGYEEIYEDDDPLNDINLHKNEVGMVPRGPRAPRAIDLTENSISVRGASQQALPFVVEEPQQQKLIIKPQNDMEPLAPNPRLLSTQSAQSNTRKSRASNKAVAAQPVQPNIASAWRLPDYGEVLNSPEEIKLQRFGDDTATLAKMIQDTLRSFRVEAEVRAEDISIGPTVIRFGIRPTGKPEMRLDEKTGKMVPVRNAAGEIVYEQRTRVSRIMALQNDLALVLEAKTIRMEAPVPGRPYVGVEIPNKNSRLVTLREVLESKEYQNARAKSKLTIGLGKDVAGQVRVGDLARMPHVLIAGATGAGKSVMVNAIIASILTQASPDDVRLLMVDPKMVELSMYNGIPHLLSPVVTEVDKVVPLLKNAINEMERRYRLFSQLGVRNLDGYRKLRLEKIGKGDTSLNNLPAIVIIIDELADLMMAAPEEVEGMICRLAQLARATGIHLVVATQRPSVDVITGLIKANIPTRISFMVSSAVDSRTIIDMGGAERLLGRGDMLYLPADAGRPERIQGSFLADEEAQRLVEYWRSQVIEHAIAVGDALRPEEEHQQHIEPGWEIREGASDDFELEDDLLDKAEEVVREYGRASISLLQRRLRIGYSRAARLIDLLEERGIIGQADHSGRGREILNQREQEDGHSMADEVADIMEEERARDEFLRKQATSQQRNTPQPQQPTRQVSPRYRRSSNDDMNDE